MAGSDNLFGGDWDDGDVGSRGVLVTGTTIGQDGEIAAIDTKVVGVTSAPGHMLKPVVTSDTAHLADQARENVAAGIADGTILIGQSRGGHTISRASAITDEYNRLLAEHHRNAVTTVVASKPPGEIMFDADKLRNIMERPNVITAVAKDDWAGVSRRPKPKPEPAVIPPSIIHVLLSQDDLEIRFRANHIIGLGTDTSNYEGVVFVYGENHGTMGTDTVEALLSLNGSATLDLFQPDGSEVDTGGDIPSSLSVLTPVQLFRWQDNVYVLFMFE